jgi:hypothetical protein
MQLYKTRISLNTLSNLQALHARTLQRPLVGKVISHKEMSPHGDPYLITLSASILEERFLSFDASTYMIEYWSYHKGEKESLKTPLAWHIDDYGAHNFKTYTLIYYTHIDTTLIGGGLFVPSTRIPVETGDVIILKGDVLHKPESLHGGYGYRDCIVVQIKYRQPSI